MKIFFTLTLLISINQIFASENQYVGEVSFKAETNVPGVNIEGVSKTFNTLKSSFSDDNLSLNKIEAEIDAKTLKTGIDMRDQHMYEKVFMVLSNKENPVLLKMVMDKTKCINSGDNLNCDGIANFTFGKKSFTKKIDLKFDKQLSTIVSFNVSLKELGVSIPSYLGIELEDEVAINMKAIKK